MYKIYVKPNRVERIKDGDGYKILPTSWSLYANTLSPGEYLYDLLRGLEKCQILGFKIVESHFDNL